MSELSRREIENLKKLSEEIGVPYGKLLSYAEEDFEYGCQRTGVKVQKIHRKKILLQKAEFFLKAFKRRIYFKEIPKEFMLIVERLEELVGWNFIKRLPTEKKKELYPVFDTINDLIDSFRFFSNLFLPSKITNYAFRDPLTKVFNRHFLEEQVYFLRNNPKLFPIGLIYVDMDNLKYINDTLGHKVGDIYIKKLAEALLSSIRNTDFIVRIGGDEFLIILLRTDENAVKEVVKRIKRNLSFANSTFRLSPIPLSASIGWSLWKSPQEPFEKALEEADLRMYEDKKRKKELSTDHGS
ncbi:diguanylate cyclase (GGDEF) domain-containing protein [Balnearium lithotrophicum]|uniref:diguanylate cyclase n=1 Tax=Balnearium lithotrophicum TaxID=223788 RepID=A0A521ASD7_9BACT|nr:diguanylate cyclase [Balnearium lithotrophicum]SMO37560.1 diguanylate cyclase (GGDEF) domain-containing protein [Balnearium lithotrophicum]